MNTVCIAGVGLIGGSFALALRRAGFSGRIIGASARKTVEEALRLGVIDESLPLPEAAAAADLIYLAQPIQRILEILDEIDAWVRPGALITDAGSTKRAIVTRAEEKIRRGRFVGGHPMAGKETRGVESAEAGLFAGRPYVLTSRDEVLESWITRIGARLVHMDILTHDHLVAVTSHIPQLASTALASLIDRHDAQRVAGPGAIDMTRLALSSYEIWRDILATNSDAIDLALSSYIERLRGMRETLRENPQEIEALFARGAKSARALRGD